MKRLDSKETNNEERNIKGASIIIVLILLFVVAVLSAITFVIEINFGKKAGTIAMIAVAAVLTAYLYRKEIGDFFRGRK